MKLLKTICTFLLITSITSCAKHKNIRFTNHTEKVIANVEILKKDGTKLFFPLCHLEKDSLRVYESEIGEFAIPLTDIQAISTVHQHSPAEKIIFTVVAVTISLLFILTYVFNPTIV
ncbi:MAG: hypothetical protein H6696_12965 [Deferribacteres bacterium]|nr:hypothetical protein [Deferribacteres bacterium]